jgi:hypothetical protein
VKDVRRPILDGRQFASEGSSKAVLWPAQEGGGMFVFKHVLVDFLDDITNL